MDELTPRVDSISGIIPLLQVGDLIESLQFYRDVLGFRADFYWPNAENPKWVKISRPDVQFMLTIDLGTSSGRFIAEKGNGVVFYATTEDVQQLYLELDDRGALIVQEIRDFGGRKQFSIADPNGYVIAFSEPF